MASTGQDLPYLPEDILVNVFSRLDRRKYVNAVMLVHKAWYHLAEEIQYSDLTLDFLHGKFLTGGASRPSRCLETIKTRDSAAKAVRHLSVTGISSGPNRTLLLEVLAKTTGLLSFNVHIDEYILDNEPLSASIQPLCASAHLLPRLTALRTNDPQLVSSLAPGRPLHAVSIPIKMDVATHAAIAESLLRSASAISQLSLYIEVESMDAAIRNLIYIAQNFRALAALSIQFRLTTSGPVTWDAIEDAIHRMAPSLSCLDFLNVVSLAYIPDPIDKATRYEAETRKLAEILVGHIPQLRRVELRWHGWKITGNVWSSVDRNELLRQPRQWLYRENRLRLDCSRNLIR